jgi:hypothetical protein
LNSGVSDRALSLLEEDGGTVQQTLLAPLRQLTLLQVNAQGTNAELAALRARCILRGLLEQVISMYPGTRAQKRIYVISI